MVMYYQGGPEIQADGLQTLYLMNPNYTTAYSDSQQQQQQQQPSENMLILNYAAGNPLVGVPLGSGNSKLSYRQLLEQQHEVSGSRLLRTPYFHQGLWGSVEQPSSGGSTGGIQSHIPTSVVGGGGGGAEVGYQRPVVAPPPTQQGLSLSLSSQQPGYNGSLPMDHNNISMITSSSLSVVSNGPFSSGQKSVVLGSKYLKSAQQLLDELVNVGRGIMEKGKEKTKIDHNKESNIMGNNLSGREETSNEIKCGGDQLTTAQKQEIQMKKAKLMSMLDEVEQRYRQYHHQIQMVIASFEQATGIGSAKSYTQLALQTISKQFRCLKDAISSQIKAASKSLGEEEEGLVGKKVKGSRQQRALQHLGMMQNNAWRPQRGLPERAVSVLRAWLFQHFLHPYPKDSDKQMLAKQTGLTRSQVSNWFINARVRLWKPMVEEMYAEEMKTREEDGSKSIKEMGSKSSITVSPTRNSPHGSFGLVCALNVDGNDEKNPKKLRSDMQNSPSRILSMDMEMKFGDSRKGFHGNGFGAFTIGELGLPLTLGPPPSENLQPNYLSEQNMDLGMAADAHYDRVS